MPSRPKSKWIPKLEDCSPSLLHTLLTFVEQQSVSKAADILGLDTPTVSRRLQPFTSRDPKKGLLERVGKRRLQLTSRGKELLPTIREVLARYEELLAHLRGRQDTAEVVRVGLGSFTAQMHLPHLLARTAGQKLWQLEARLMRGQERITSVAEGRLDLAVVTHGADDIGGLAVGRLPLEIECLARHPLVIVAHPDTDFGRELSELSDDRPAPLSKLARKPLVGLDPQSGLRQELQRRLPSASDLWVVHEHQPGGWALGREYARRRLGAALLPLPVVTAQDRDDFVVRLLAPAFRIEEHLISRKGKRTQGQAAAVKCLREIARGKSQGE